MPSVAVHQRFSTLPAKPITTANTTTYCELSLGQENVYKALCTKTFDGCSLLYESIFPTLLFFSS